MISKFLPLRRAAPLHRIARYAFICARSNSSTPITSHEGVVHSKRSPGREDRFFKPKPEQKQKASHSPKPKPQPETPPTEEQLERMQRTLFLGGIYKTAKNADVKEFCQTHGVTPTRVIMPIDCNSGRNPSYAFLEFASKVAATDAISKLHGKYLLQDKHVRVEPVTTDPEIMFANFKAKPTQYFPDFERDYDVEDVLKPIKEERKIFAGAYWANPVKSKPLRNALQEAFRAYAVETMSATKLDQRGKHFYMETATREEADRIMDEMSEVEVLGARLRLERVVLREEDNPLTIFSTRFLGDEEERKRRPSKEPRVNAVW